MFVSDFEAVEPPLDDNRLAPDEGARVTCADGASVGTKLGAFVAVGKSVIAVGMGLLLAVGIDEGYGVFAVRCVGEIVKRAVGDAELTKPL